MEALVRLSWEPLLAYFMLTPFNSRRGCVSGAQIENIRDKIRMGDNEYRWDAIDGYEELK